MLFLGTVRSPSYLAELRALRLAAATCDRLPNRAIVIKFAVVARRPRRGLRRPNNYCIQAIYHGPGAQCFIDQFLPTECDPDREPLHLVRGRALGKRDDRLPLSQLRSGEDRAMRALPRPIRTVPLPDLLVHRPVRCTMGSVAITFRVMPDEADADLEAIKSQVRTSLGRALRDLKEQPVAFGLKAILAIAVIDDSAGGSEEMEQRLSSIPGVGSVETVDVTLV